MVAQGASPGTATPTPFDAPSPAWAGEGGGGEGGFVNPRLTPWAKLCRRCAAGRASKLQDKVDACLCKGRKLEKPQTFRTGLRYLL
jgi:hypothetical protein